MERQSFSPRTTQETLPQPELQSERAIVVEQRQRVRGLLEEQDMAWVKNQYLDALPRLRKTLRVCYPVLRKNHEDILQEVFISLYRFSMSHGTDQIKNPGSLMNTCLANRCRDRLRRIQRWNLLSFNGGADSVEGPNLVAPRDFQSEEPDTLEGAMTAFQRLLDEGDISTNLKQAMYRLSWQQFEAFVLYWKGMEASDIAKLLGLPYGTVQSRLHYARKKLHHPALDALQKFKEC